jgi:hypothetical protein
MLPTVLLKFVIFPRKTKSCVNQINLQNLNNRVIIRYLMLRNFVLSEYVLNKIWSKICLIL